MRIFFKLQNHIALYFGKHLLGKVRKLCYILLARDICMSYFLFVQYFEQSSRQNNILNCRPCELLHGRRITYNNIW